MKLVAVLALAGGLMTAPVISPPTSSAVPCDGAGCVPYVQHDAAAGKWCAQTGTYYLFGLDASGNTYLCNRTGYWESSPPLIGIRTLRSPCDGETGMAQSPDGLPLSCKNGGWSLDYEAVYF